ncbi:MAG: porin family protein [Chryseotalea sp.]|jgi:hypothetical protein
MLKKITLLSVLMLALCLQLNAQAKFGLKGGLNLSKEKFEDSGVSVESENRTGFHVGFFIQAPITEKLFFQPEVFYSQEGGELNVSGFTVKDELDFVNVPLLLKIAPAKSFNLVVGPQIGFLVSAKQDVNGTKRDIEGVKSVNTSFSFGAGFNITDEIEIYGRYNIGLVNLNESNSGSSEIKMNTLQFGLGISL